MGTNAVLEPSLYFNVLGNNFCLLKTPIGAVSCMSENFRSKGQRSGSPDDQRRAKLQFWSHPSISMYQVAIFAIENTYLGSCLIFLKILGPNVKVTRGPNIGKNAVLEPHALYKRGF